MFPEGHEFWIHTSMVEKRLFVSRPKVNPSGALSPCDMTPDDVDFEMAQGKHPEILEICGMNQKSLEHFVTHYAKSYRYLSFFKCQLIQDFSPLEDLENLEAVHIWWNIRTDRLWNMQKNKSLVNIDVSDAKKLTLKPLLVNTSPTLQSFGMSGSIFGNYPTESLEIFEDMPALRSLSLSHIRLMDRSMDSLGRMPALEAFNFDPGMLTFEEIAAICAKYPHLSGCSLGPYCPSHPGSKLFFRVCGARKPEVQSPEQQHVLDKYEKKFNELVAAYRSGSLPYPVP